MIRMAAFPIWDDHGVRLEFADYFSDRDLLRVAIFKMSVRKAEIPPDFHAQYFGGACRFLQPRFRRTARARFAACQIQNARAISCARHFQHCAAGRQLHVIWMGRDCQQIKSHSSSVSTNDLTT